MKAKRVVLGMVLPLTLFLGCGSDSGGGNGASSGYPVCSDCQHAKYVVGPRSTAATDHGITIPGTTAQVTALGCDQNGDGTPDNKLGSGLVTLKQLQQNLDVQVAVDDSFRMGSVIILFDIEFKPSITDTSVAGVKTYIGMHDSSDGQTAPGFYSSGTGKFTVNGAATGAFGGKVAAGAGSFGKGGLTIQFPLVAGQPPLTVQLVNVQLRGTYATNGVQNGILCGAITSDELHTTIYPQVAILLSAQIKAGGATAVAIKGLLDTDMSCNTEAACLTPTAPGTCMCISEQEVETNGTIQNVLGLDLDLDPNKNNPFVMPDNAAAKNDALSVGFGFEASTAMFTAQ